ncbi:MAG: hypothetical protein ABSF46_27550 [Terriglobia bacterium]
MNIPAPGNLKAARSSTTDPDNKQIKEAQLVHRSPVSGTAGKRYAIVKQALNARFVFYFVTPPVNGQC